MRVAPFEPAAGPPAPAAAEGAEPLPAGRRLRLAAWAGGGVTILGAVALIAWELAAVRVPQHRAALEELIRQQTGLEVTFRELSVRWGWYGPEAVFDHVVLGEPGGGGSLLRAPRLVVGLDSWRMVRSGELAAGRITLLDPDIDLAAGVRAARTTPGRPAGHEAVLSTGARLLSRWRGGRIELEGGTLHWPLPGVTPLTLNVRHAELRRLGPAWDADVELLLPASLGESVHLSAQMRGDPAEPHALSGTLTFDGRRLELAGWRGLARSAALERYLPEGGLGNLELGAEFMDGRLVRADGRVRAEGLAWGAGAEEKEALGVERLQGEWQLARRSGPWRLEAHALESDKAVAATVGASVEVAPDASAVHGRLEGAPLALLAAVARRYAPQLPLSNLRLEGVARELVFDWSARRPAGERLRTSAQLEELTIASPAGELALGGLTAHVSGVDARLTADLHASAAQLRAGGGQAAVLDGLAVAARLLIGAQRGGWQLRSDELAISGPDLALAASGALEADGPGAQPQVAAHVALRKADVAQLARLLGAPVLAALGARAAQLSAGRIENADLEWRGALDTARPWGRAGNGFRGAFELHDATVRGSDSWPDVRHLDAHVEWRGPHVHAAVDAGDAGTFQLAAASADWDARGGRPIHLTALLTASAQPALAWLRAHPQLAAYAPGMQDVDLRGDALLDVDLIVPAAPGGATERATPARPSRSRITALFDGVELRAVAGLPPIEGLHGALGFAAGRLQPSQLTGQWLGGPVTLGVAERRDADVTALTISGRGVAEAHQALLAAGANDEAMPMLQGRAEWSALLTFLPGSDATRSRWRLRADSSLMGVSSRLPEPFAKAEGLALPVHVEVQAGADSAQLRLALGERLRASAALERSGELWRIERGAVRLASTAPALPADPLLVLEGRMSRLDLPACLALWRQAGRDAALPALRAHLSAAQLTIGPRSFGEVSVAGEAAPRGGRLELESPEISGTASWPAAVDTEHPALVELSRLNVTQLEDAALGAALAAALGPVTRLSVGDLQWQGRSLGSLRAQLALGPDSFDAGELELAGDSQDAHASVHCQDAACQARFTLDSRDAAATLSAFGFRPELTASRARLEGELEWPQQGGPPLATLDGRLHMQLEQGVTRGGAASHEGARFALLTVPALTGGLRAENRAGVLPELGFARLTADFTVHEGQATTSNLHFDGDAEILVRGRMGLLAHDYDEQAWILRGEERLPAAVRRLGATPKVAAVWLSLRELFNGPAADRTQAALRLRGTWEEPMVTSAE